MRLPGSDVIFMLREPVNAGATVERMDAEFVEYYIVLVKKETKYIGF